jgi:DNA polymerase-3 subunit gamma/tau
MPTTALHQKYRPKTLSGLVGQPYVQTTLTNAIDRMHIAPAYLFTGSRGTGKTSTARIFAKSLNCLEADSPIDQPCGVCLSCRSVEMSTSLNVSEIDAASNNGVDDARALIEHSSLAPIGGRYRIFILDECLAGDSLVLTDSGLVRIDNPAIVGKNALSYNETNERWEFKLITRQWIKGKRRTLVIKTAGTEIRCTPEHLIRTNHGWKKAETIQPGDRILIAPTTFLPKSGSKSLNHCDPFVPVAVENAWTFPFSTNAAPSIMSSTPTGSNTRLNEITELSNQLQTKSLCSNLHDLSAPVDVAESLRFRPIFSITELLSPEFSITGQNIPTTIGMVASKQQSEIAMMPSNPSHPKLWGEFTELCSVMDRSAIPMPIPFLPECLGHTALTSKTGYAINVISSQSLFPKSTCCQIGAMGKPQFVAEPSATPISEKSTAWCDQIAITSESIQTGSTVSVKRDWHGGIWMMDRSVTLPLVHSLLPCTQKDIRDPKTSSCSNGLNPLDIQLPSGVSRNKAKSTMLLDSQQPVVENGSNSSASMPLQQWHTNSTCVESVVWSGVAEPVYDLEVADNHNFVANGLLVHNCHQLTTQSQNALLKCIEEPPPHVVFILCTTEVHKVLPTIVSRCQVFHFRALSIQTITQHLQEVARAEAIAVSDDALMAIARFAEGGLRDALQLLGQVSLLGETVTANHVIEMTGGVTATDLLIVLEAIATNDTFQLLQSARLLVDSGKTPKLILSSLLQTYRDLLILKAAPQAADLLTSPVNYSQLKAITAHWDFDTLNQSLAQLQKAESYLRNTTNASVWLETCLLNLMPMLRSISFSSPDVKQAVGKNGHSRKAISESSSATTAHKPTDLAALWQKVVASAKPGTQKLLTQARLTKLQGTKAILEVTPASFAKFEANQQAIARMLQRVTQTQKPMTVLIRTLTATKNGRSA